MSVRTSTSNVNSDLNSNEFEGEGEEQYIPIRESASSSIRDSSAASGVDQNRHSDTASVGSAWARFDTSTQSHTEDLNSHFEENENLNETENEASPQGVSLQHRLVNAASGAGSSALFGSLELLKIAGGITLSTTGTIIAPSLKVTQQIILPSLFAATMDYIKKLTPQRVKDWFRILYSSFFNFFSVLREVPRGREFRSRLVTVGGDVVDCISSDASRQVITDGMATFVKLAEAMHTPEFKSFLDQSNVLGARLIDAASSGRNKQLVNDIKETFWSGIGLASDPATIIALAEVTATLCHTLEMEEVLHRRKKQDPKRRFERNEFTQKAYADADLAQDPNTTVEQVIMSSLGGVSTVSTESTRPPLSVTVDPLESSINEAIPVDEAVPRDAQGRLSGPNQQVDKDYLEQMINQRADARVQQMNPARLLRPPIATTQQNGALKSQSASVSRLDPEELRDDIEDFIPETVLDDDDDVDQPSGLSLERQQTPKSSNLNTPSSDPLIYEQSFQPQDPQQEENGKSHTSPPSTEETSEPGVSRFYRMLDEIMERKRQEAVNEMDATNVLATVKSLAMQPKASASAKKKNFATLQRAAKKATLVQNLLEKVDKTSKKDSGLVMVASLFFLCIMTLWFGFGCYGMYTFFRGSVGQHIGMGRNLHQASKPVFSPKTVPLSNVGSTQEIVIRVIKEVVHVNQHGHPVDRGGNQAEIDGSQPFDIQQLAECVSANDAPMDEEKIAQCVAGIL